MNENNSAVRKAHEQTEQVPDINEEVWTNDQVHRDAVVERLQVEKTGFLFHTSLFWNWWIEHLMG